MSLTTYCDFAEVRSTLGVNDSELKDQVLGLPVYEMGLVRELNKVSTSLNAAFSALYAKTRSERTAEESNLHDAVRLFSVYAVAKQVGVSLANFAPKDISDGKASVGRFSGTPFETVLDRIDGMYSSLKEELRAAYEAFTGASSKSSTTPFKVLGKSQNAYDPVKGA
jgi:hypothetical protein